MPDAIEQIKRQFCTFPGRNASYKIPKSDVHYNYASPAAYEVLWVIS